MKDEVDGRVEKDFGGIAGNDKLELVNLTLLTKDDYQKKIKLVFVKFLII